MKLVVLPEEQRCVHVRSNGARCEGARRAGRERCEIHEEWFASAAAVLGLQFPEDAISLHRMLGTVLGMVVSHRIGFKTSRSVVELCRMLASNLAAYEEEVREVERKGRKAVSRF
jgi:hypothetical protein